MTITGTSATSDTLHALDVREQPTIAVDITACDAEPIHIPGSIQPYGLLLVVDPMTLLVLGGAGAIETRLASEWLEQDARQVLGRSIDVHLAALVAGDVTIAVLEPIIGRDETFDGVARLVDGNVIIELEPTTQRQSGGQLLSMLDAASAAFDRSTDFPSLCQAAATEFRKLTGFDRVMIYRFLDDQAGTVVADDQTDELGSFLNHHFPAADIPKQARALYVRNRIRVIQDVGYVLAPLRPGAEWQTLDMSDIGLRSVSPIHIQYLKNMEVGASASVSIVKDGVLWGLIACHHRTPRALSYETRVACNTLAAVLSRQIKAKDDDESYRQRIRLRSQEDAVTAHLGSLQSLTDFFAGAGSDLCRMLGASGFAAVQGTELYLAGKCPEERDVREVAQWVRGRGLAQPFASDRLASEFPAARAYQDRASGLLAVTMSTDEPIILLWFRAEQVEVVNWAGNPHKPVGDDAGKPLILTPRASFEAWSETVRGRSVPWTLAEVEAVNRLRRTMFDIRQAHRLRALNVDLAATIADNESLLVQKDYLIKEVNHRIQNSLQLVSAFLGLQARAVGDDALTAHLDEAQRRLAAVALVHKRLYSGDQIQTIDLARYLEDLCTDITGSMGDAWGTQISLDLAPVLLSTDRAVNVGLILTELIINANKYAYGGQPGPVSVSLDQHRNSFRLVVADRGVGKQDGRGEGFGSRMLGAMVKRLNGTLENSDNSPGLRVTVDVPIQDRRA